MKELTQRQKHIVELRKSINSRSNISIFHYLSLNYLKLYMLSFIFPPYVIYKLIKNKEGFEPIERFIWLMIPTIYMVYLARILLW